jgi:hypothetical protein
VTTASKIEWVRRKVGAAVVEQIDNGAIHVDHLLHLQQHFGSNS